MVQLVYKIIYHPDVNFILRNINRFLFPILPKKIRIPPSGILKIVNKEGKVLKIKTNQTNYLTHLLFWEGGYEQFEYTSIFIRVIKKINTFFDIGANIGYYSLLGTLENPGIKIVGFEPAEGPFHYFKENIDINNFSNIKAEQLALSNIDGMIEFYEIHNVKYKYLKYNLAGESNAGTKTKGRKYHVNHVKSMTLDEYIRKNNITEIDLIKIDTEGTEHQILEKSRIVLEQLRPIIICETLFNTIEAELEEIFSKYHYQFFVPVLHGLEKRETIIRKEDDGIRNCFFVPSEKMEFIQEFIVE